MIKNGNNHKNRFHREKIDYSFSRRANERSVPFKIMLKVLIGGFAQIFGIFLITNLLASYITNKAAAAKNHPK